MAQISDETLLQWERLRANLVYKLQDRGIDIDSTATMEDAVDSIDEIWSTEYINGIMNKDISVLRIDSLINSVSTNTSNVDAERWFSSSAIFGNVVGLFLPNLKVINRGITLRQSNALVHVYMPNLESYNHQDLAFNSKNIINLVLPKLITSNDILVGHTCTKKFIIPKCSVDGNLTYQSNKYLLEVVDLCDCNKITSSGTSGILDKLTTLIIRNDNHIPTLSGTAQMDNIEGIYVPESMVDSYKVATNWALYEDVINPIEDSQYEDLDWYENTEWYQEEIDYWRTIYPDFEF